MYAFLALIDAEYSAKTWNKHADFVLWLKAYNIDPHFFQYRDDRFDGLAHGCAFYIPRIKVFWAAVPVGDKVL